jgi:hypothetical protein
MDSFKGRNQEWPNGILVVNYLFRALSINPLEMGSEASKISPETLSTSVTTLQYCSFAIRRKSVNCNYF